MTHDVSSEMDLVFTAGYWLRDNGYSFNLNKYMGTTELGKAFVDMLVLDHSGTPKLIIEFKMDPYLRLSGECDCKDTLPTQYEKYCMLDLPLWTCNGYKDLDATLEYVKEKLS